MTIDISTLGIAVDSSQVRKGASDLDGLAASGGRAEKSTLSLTSASSRLAGAFGIVASAIASVGISKFIAETSTLNQRYQELGIVLGVVSRNAGLSALEVDKVAESVRKSGISMIESRQIVARLVQSQIDLSKATELARLAQDAAVVGQINSSEALDRMVHGITSAQVEVLRGIGINVDFEQSYKKMAQEIGVSTAALTEQQKMQARLNVVLAESTKLNGVYAASMDNAGKQMRSTERLVEDLKVKIGGLFDATSRFAVSAYTGALKEADSAMDSMTETGGIVRWGDTIARVAAFAADSVRSVGIVFDITGKAIGAMAAQAVAIAKFDFSSAFKIQGDFNKDFDSAIGSMSKMRDIVEKQIVARDLLVPAIKRGSDVTRSNTAEVLSNASAKERATKAVEGLTLAELRQQESTKRIIDLDQDVKRVIESVATEQEKYNQELERLNTLKPNLPIGIYERALQKLNGTTKESAVVTKQTTDEIGQLWMQAGRNIQSALANGIFNFFDDGLKGMVRSVVSTVGRIASEFAALKLAQGIGLSSMFAIPGAAMASGGTGGTGIGGFDIASLGANAAGLVKSGFGLNSLIGGGMSAIGGSGLLGSFGAGMSGGGAAASFIAAESATAGAGMAASMGASVASFAGPAIAVAAVDQIVRMLAGDKMLGGTAGKVLNFVPVIGPLINGLFGRGPLKQKGTTLSGSVGAEGFTSGSLQTDFVAKGGLFRSDKNDFARVDAVTGAVSTDNDKLQGFADQLAKSSREIIGLINDTTTQVSTSLRTVGRDLGLSVDSIDSFSRSIELVSEKGKLLTEEQIANEISAITDELARGLIPEVDSLSKRGESAIQTVNRLGIEFNALVDGAVVILDRTIAESKKLVQSVSFQDRTEFVDAAGGVDALSQKISFFAQNFLTESERLAPAQEQVTEELSKLGLSSNITRDQFRELVQSYGQVNGITGETLQALLNLAPAFISVTQAAESATEAAKQQASVALNDAFSALQKSVDVERQKITDHYNEALKTVNERIQNVSESIEKLRTLSDALKSTVDTLRPMSREQAKSQIQQAIDAARSGKALPDAKDLQQALGVLGDKSTSGFKSSFEFAREQAKTANLIGELGGLTDKQLTIEERSLSALESQRDRLEQGFRDEIERLDSLLEQGKLQIDSMNGLNTSVLSLVDALGQLNLRLLQGGGSAVVDPSTGGAPVGGTGEERGKLINQFINAPGRTPEEVYAESVKFGVTAEELDSQSKYSLKEINDWIDSKGLKRLTGIPGFASGGMHRGGLRIVGERGPELESTGPGHITSNNDLKNIVNNDGVVKAISDLQAEIKEVKTSNDKVRKILDSVTQGGTFLRVKNIV